MGGLHGWGGGQGGGRGLHRVRRMRTKGLGGERRKEKRRGKSPDGELLQGYSPSVER